MYSASSGTVRLNPVRGSRSWSIRPRPESSAQDSLPSGPETLTAGRILMGKGRPPGPSLYSSALTPWTGCPPRRTWTSRRYVVAGSPGGSGGGTGACCAKARLHKTSKRKALTNKLYPRGLHCPWGMDEVGFSNWLLRSRARLWHLPGRSHTIRRWQPGSRAPRAARSGWR